MLHALKALSLLDSKTIMRDNMLRWLIPFPVFISLLLRYLVQFAQPLVLEHWAIDIYEYNILFGSFIILAVPIVFGMILGFMLLDQRDDGTLVALQVSPIPINLFLAYRLILPMIITMPMTVLAVELYGLANIPYTQLMLAMLISAPLTPMAALFLACFASNKIQGFVLAKSSNIFMLPPVFAYFIDSHWQFVFGVFPTYWPVKIFWLQNPNTAELLSLCAAAVIVQYVLALLLLKRFNRRLYEASSG